MLELFELMNHLEIENEFEVYSGNFNSLIKNRVALRMDTEIN
jgi:hypothetical protein